MENASKALIIGGSVLLSVLIIGLGMAIFGMVDTSSGSKKLDEQAVQAFNSTFDPYLSSKISGTRIKALLTAAATQNAAAEDDSLMITICFQDAPTSKGDTLNGPVKSQSDINMAKSKIGSGKMYAVGVTLDKDGSGKYAQINIAQQGKNVDNWELQEAKAEESTT